MYVVSWYEDAFIRETSEAWIYFCWPATMPESPRRGSCHAINIAFASKPPLRSNTTRSRTISEHYFDPSLRLKIHILIVLPIATTKCQLREIPRERYMLYVILSSLFHAINDSSSIRFPLRQSYDYFKGNTMAKLGTKHLYLHLWQVTKLVTKRHVEPRKTFSTMFRIFVQGRKIYQSLYRREHRLVNGRM